MTALAAILLREAYVCWRFIRGDLSTTIVPGVLFGSASLIVSRASVPLDVGWFLIKEVIFFWLYLYTFCLSNQLTGIDEDRLNKPNRPLPAGLITVASARRRLVAYTALYLLVSAGFGVLQWAVLWSAITLLHNFCGLDRHWFTKNCVAMSLGSLAGLAAAWELVAPLSPAALSWLLIVAAFAGLTFSVQDFRDMEGDRLRGRLTLPLWLGPGIARLVMAALLVVLPLGLLGYLLRLERAPHLLLSLLYIGLLLLQLWLVAARLLLLRRKRDDRRTYTLYTYSYCTMVLGVFLFV